MSVFYGLVAVRCHRIRHKDIRAGYRCGHSIYTLVDCFISYVDYKKLGKDHVMNRMSQKPEEGSIKG